MAIAVAEQLYSIEIHDPVDPHLRLVQSRTEQFGGGENQVDQKRLLDFLNAPVVLGVRQPQEFSARLIAIAGREEASITGFADVAMRAVNGSRAVVVRCHASALTLGLVTALDPSVEITSRTDVPPPTLVWSLAPRFADATARADILDFLRVLHRESQVRIINTDSGQSVGTLDGPGAPFDEDLEQDWRFTTDVATLEEWSNMPLPLPSEVDADEVARIQQAAQFVRSRRVSVTFSGDFKAVLSTPPLVDSETQVEIEQDFGVLAFGFDVPLGTGRADLPVRVVAVTLDPTEPDAFHVTMQPLARGTTDFTLVPPPERIALKRTLAPGEQPDTREDARAIWDATWVPGEREAESEIRTGQTIRFATEDDFYHWVVTADSQSDG